MNSRNLYFTSDTHFSHFNIIRLCNRPFTTAEEMNEKLIQKWNDRVRPEDDIYHLGDVIFYRSTNGNGLKIKPIEILKKLNGTITYVRGNHDENNGLNLKNHRIVIYISKIFINLVHKPEHGNMDYDLNLCGHVHDKWKVMVKEQDGKKSLFINVGVDQWNFAPVPWQKLYEIYNQWKAGQNVEEIYNKT